MAEEKRIRIEGMVCDNCAARVQNALNAIEGVSAKVRRSRGEAVVKADREIDADLLTGVISDLGYKVIDIR
ncbi:MAG: cation transporter [Lachnospiraceae bacterium]|nr:cation transporter [Lachnospiraceae bacterium]